MYAMFTAIGTMQWVESGGAEHFLLQSEYCFCCCWCCEWPLVVSSILRDMSIKTMFSSIQVNLVPNQNNLFGYHDM